MTVFLKWSGPEGIEPFIKNETNCKPFSGAGINPRPQNKTTILRSVDNTYYYQDDLSDKTNVEYTLYGPNGDQDINEKKMNEPLLNPTKTQHIYLYRKTPTHYIWYGKYIIKDMTTKLHIGKDGNMRKIIVLSLKQFI